MYSLIWKQTENPPPSPNIQNKNALPQTSISGLSDSFPLTHSNFAGYALSWLFIASNPKIYWEWSGSVDCQYPCSLVFRPENPPPPLLWRPPPPHLGRDRGWTWRGDILTVLLVYLACEQRTVEGYLYRLSCFEIWFFSNCSVKQPSGYLCLDWIGIGFCEWALTESERIITIIHHLSSPQSSPLRNLSTLSTLGWK